jgi:adenosylhomocysteine nucleosidase
MTKVAIVAALEREVRPLVRNWPVIEREYEGKRFKFFEDGKRTVLVCGGIGAQPARRAAAAVITLYQPEIVQSVGFAGALDPLLTRGEIFSPARVIDGRDGSSVSIANGSGILLSFHSVAGTEQKSKLARAYGAQAIDMEASAVAQSAGSHGLRFGVTKVISDEFDFEMPAMDRFIDHDGQFHTGRFVAFTAVRPWLWARAVRLGRESAKAAKSLCRELHRQLSTELDKTELNANLRV